MWWWDDDDASCSPLTEWSLPPPSFLLPGAGPGATCSKDREKIISSIEKIFHLDILMSSLVKCRNFPIKWKENKYKTCLKRGFVSAARPDRMFRSHEVLCSVPCLGRGRRVGFLNFDIDTVIKCLQNIQKRGLLSNYLLALAHFKNP